MSVRYPLSWPEGRPRTPVNHKRHNGSWKLGTHRYRGHLYDELRKMGVESVIISTNKPLRVDGEFRIDVPEPADGGVAVYFDYQGKQLCLACDRYHLVEDNLHAIGLTVEAIRSIERHGTTDMMERAFRGFTALPEKAGEYWREVLEIPADAKVTTEQIEKQFRFFALVKHPDKGGTMEEWQQLVNARENALKDLGVTR